MSKGAFPRGAVVADLNPDEITSFGTGSKCTIPDQVALQYLFHENLELKAELARLREDVSRNKKRISQLEKRKKSYGKQIIKRAEYMVQLIEDYGGMMTSSDVRKRMAFSKDEFYRTIKCAKEHNVIELLPNPDDRRGYIIKNK